jgi:hypothetical protein
MLIAEEIRKTPGFAPLADNNAVGEAWAALRAAVERDFENTVNGNVYWAATILLARAQSKLQYLASLKYNWDSYGAPKPNQISLENAARLLEHLKPFDLALVNIVPSAEGGIGLCFVNEDRYADLECSNDGEIIGVKYRGKQSPSLIETDGTDASIQAAIQQIRIYVGA